MNTRYGSPENLLAHYTCFRAPGPIRVDGRLDEAAWREVPKSQRFVDMVTGDPGFFDTRVSCLWDDRAFYVGFHVEEPDVRASLTERDSFICLDNDVEVFIGGDDCYYEFEINAFGTVYEVFFVWQDALRQGSRFDKPEYDLRSRNVDLLGGLRSLVQEQIADSARRQQLWLELLDSDILELVHRGEIGAAQLRAGEIVDTFR